MARPLAPRPSTAVLWVHATLLNASFAGLVGCAGSEVKHQAPTCGPCCHGSTGPECQVHAEPAADARPATPDGPPAVAVDARVAVPVPDDLRQVAPTCGPCCHGSKGPECGGGPDGR